jgi:hypothetical protein
MLTLIGPNALSHNDVVDRQPIYHSFRDAPDPIVTLKHSARDIPGPAFNYSFPPHSVTVIVLQAR